MKLVQVLVSARPDKESPTSRPVVDIMGVTAILFVILPVLGTLATIGAQLGVAAGSAGIRMFGMGGPEAVLLTGSALAVGTVTALVSVLAKATVGHA